MLQEQVPGRDESGDRTQHCPHSPSLSSFHPQRSNYRCEGLSRLPPPRVVRAAAPGLPRAAAHPLLLGETGDGEVWGESWQPWGAPTNPSSTAGHRTALQIFPSPLPEVQVCSLHREKSVLGRGEKGTEALLPCCRKKRVFFFQGGCSRPSRVAWSGASQPTPRDPGRSCAPTSSAAPRLHPPPRHSTGAEDAARPLQRGLLPAAASAGHDPPSSSLEKKKN